MADFDIGNEVSWNWGTGTASGTIRERYVDKVSRNIKGTEVTRNATNSDPAYLIEQKDGDVVLKSGSELTKDS